VEDIATLEYTGSSSQVSLRETSYFDGGSQTRYMSMRGLGYGNVARSFATRTGVAKKVRLRAKVTRIQNWDSNDVDTLITYTQNGKVKRVSSKTVLVTVSLGVLKAGNIKFTPTLPLWKQKVINNMGYGTLNKCIFLWNSDDDMAWPENTKWLYLVTPDKQSSGKWTSFFNPTRYKGVPVRQTVGENLMPKLCFIHTHTLFFTQNTGPHWLHWWQRSPAHGEAN